MRRRIPGGWLLLLGWLAGCGSEPEPAPLPTRAAPAAEESGSGDLYVLYDKPIPRADDPDLFAAAAEPPRARAPQPTVVLAILDTVRADHLSACGYFRPTSPTLEALVQRGAQLTCRAYAPADWTLPSHASFFTGRAPEEHGAGWASPQRETAPVVETHGLSIHPLGPQLPTLAERMAQRGYQSVLVSANRLLTGATGLSRGFAVALSPPESADPRRPWVDALLGRALREQVDPAQPLFLVLNILDAHDPWLAPPSALAWPGLGQARVPPEQFAADFVAYPNDRLAAADAEPFRRQLADLYDYGVFRADAHLGRSLGVLERAGWLGAGARVIVTSDHGENLGEHALVRHSLVYEGNTRVPLLYWQVGRASAPALPEPVSALVVHSLALAGELPEALPAVQSLSVPSRKPFPTPEASAFAAAAWQGHDKLMLAAGAWRRFDLREDPFEQRPLPVRDDDPRRRALAAARSALEAPARERPEASGALLEELKALGYVQ